MLPGHTTLGTFVRWLWEMIRQSLSVNHSKFFHQHSVWQQHAKNHFILHNYFPKIHLTQEAFTVLAQQQQAQSQQPFAKLAAQYLHAHVWDKNRRKDVSSMGSFVGWLKVMTLSTLLMMREVSPSSCLFSFFCFCSSALSCIRCRIFQMKPQTDLY